MNYIRILLLIFILFLSPYSIGADFREDVFSAHKSAITVKKHFEKDFIKNENSSLFCPQINSENILNKNQKNSSSGLSNENTYIEPKNKDFCFKNIYSKIFLNNKNETLVSILLFQIQPNAP